MTRVVRAQFPPPSPLLVASVAIALASVAGCAKKTPPVTDPAVPTATVTSRTATRAPAPTLEPSLASLDRGVMAAELDQFFAAPGLRTAVWSVLVQSLDTGEVLYRLNPDTLVLPASNQKIVSTAVAAARLGWDFRFETRIEAIGVVTDGVLQGDLVVSGNGDPTINARDGRRDTFFDELASALRTAGIRSVSGRLVGDDNAFDDERFGFGWSWDDFVYGFSAPIGPLQVNENIVGLSIRPGAAAGEPAAVVAKDAGSDLALINHVVTGTSDSTASIDVTRLPGQRELTVTGTVPLGGKELTRTAAADNPTAYFVGEAKAALAARGIVVGGAAVDIDDLDGQDLRTARRLVGTLQSPPLADAARPLMKVSQNLYAETFLRALSLGPAPATVEASKKLMEETLGRWGVPTGTFVVADGSGLSRYNLVNASMIVAILRAVARDPKLYDGFVSTLPIGGKDGTIGNRMKGTLAEGNVLAKTGSLTGVRALSGYLTSSAGERIVFSAIANNFTTPNATVDAAVEQALQRVIARGR